MSRSIFGWVSAALLGSVIAALGACGSSGSTDTSAAGTSGCTPGEQKSCACPGGTEGVQTCADDGRSLNACECGGSGTTTTGGSGGAGGGASTGTQMTTLCGDGIQQPGECEPTNEMHTYCAADCDKPPTSTSTSTGGACSGHVYYAGLVPNVSSVWVSGGLTSLAAGDDMCQKANLGADHVCDYEEVLKAQTNGELSTIAAGTTAWVQRTTSAMVGGVASPAGPGGRCNDWKYNTNHISDGEYVTFPTMGTPAYHLDNDTIYDVTMPGSHTIPGDLDCNGATRNIMCCFTSCN